MIHMPARATAATSAPSAPALMLCSSSRSSRRSATASLLTVPIRVLVEVGNGLSVSSAAGISSRSRRNAIGIVISAERASGALSSSC